MIPPLTTVDVVVPAADEEASIGACLDALLTALAVVRAARPGLTATITVVLDRCTDGTAAVVARHPGVRTVRSTARNVGAARALGTAAALRRHPGAAVTGWLAHTDADSTVPADWLARMADEADRGADLVLGTVRPGRGLDPVVRARWAAEHAMQDGHDHVHGANLGVRASAYAALGGFRALATGEDVDLVTRGRAAGLVVSRPGDIAVTTSARLVGRAPEGFADYLHDLAGSRFPASGTAAS